MLSEKQILIIKNASNYIDLIRSHPEIVYIIRKNKITKFYPDKYRDKISPTFWTEELIQQCANFCRNRLEFRNYFNGAYKAAEKKGILDKVMEGKTYAAENYTKYSLESIKEVCIEKAVHSFYEFRTNFPGPYQQAYQKGWNPELKIFFADRILKKYSNLFELANTLKTNFPHIYNRNKDLVLKEFFGHYPNKLAEVNDLIIKILISELPSVENLKTLCKEKGFKNTLKQFQYIKLLPKKDQESLREIANLKVKKRFKKTIKVKRTAPFIYTKDLVIKEAKKYTTRKEFSLKARGCYEFAYRRKILDEVCSHMTPPFESLGEQLVRQSFNYYYRTIFYKIKPDWIVNPKTGLKLELDGYNDNLKIAFEVNGLHHYESIHQDVEIVKYKDEYKIKRCKEQGVELYIFKYERDFKELIIQINELLDIPFEWLNKVAFDLTDKLTVDEILFYRKMVGFNVIPDVTKVSYQKFAKLINTLRKQNLSNFKIRQVLNVTSNHLQHRILRIHQKGIQIINR